LEDDEAEIVVEIDEATTRGEEIVPALCLVGRFLSMKPVYMFTYDVGEDEGDMVSTERITITTVDDGLFLFQFNLHRDLKKVPKGGPWFFGKHIMVLCSMLGEAMPS
jgi:hypothetical protein